MRSNPVTDAVSGLGSFYAMCIDTARALGRRPFAWREYVLQCWFITRVSLLPTALMAFPFTEVFSPGWGLTV